MRSNDIAERGSKSAAKPQHEPLFHITKREQMPFWKSAAIRVAAIVIALIVGGIVTYLLTGDNPVSVYKTIFEGAFGNKQRTWFSFQQLAILLGISLALAPAFKMRFWNTGAEGQVLIGCLATAMCMFCLGDKLPYWALVCVMCVASVLAGAIWGVFPAVFKAFWNTNETLFTLMMNYVAIKLIECFLKIADKSGSNTVGPDILKNGWLPVIGGQKYLLNILVVAALTVFMYVYLRYTKHGYEIAVVGESENTARYVGINVKKVIVRTMAVSGAICGLIGLLLVGGSSHSIDANLADGRGFTAIMVCWLAKFNPIFMTLTALLIVFLDRGAEEISSKFGLNDSFSDILTGIILFFIIGSEFFIQYRVHINKKHKFFAKKKEEAVK